MQSDAFYEQGRAACTTWVFLMLTMIAHHMFVPAVFLCFSEMMNPPASISCRTDPPPEWSNQTDCRLDFGWALHLLTQFGIPWLERWDVFFRFFSYRLGHLMATHSIIERNRQPRPFFLSAIWPRAKAAKPSPLSCAPLWWLERPPKAVGRSR